MTEKEQALIIGEVVQAIADTRRKLACLETKAENMSLEFGLLCNWLTGHFPSGVALDDNLSVSDALTLVKEIKETRKRLEQLQARRDEMGV